MPKHAPSYMDIPPIDNEDLRATDEHGILSDLEPASSGREAKPSAPASATIGTLNARTLTQNHRLYELAKLSKNQNYDIINTSTTLRRLDRHRPTT